MIVSWILYLLGSMTVRRTTDYESMNTAHSNILILVLILKTNTGFLT